MAPASPDPRPSAPESETVTFAPLAAASEALTVAPLPVLTNNTGSAAEIALPDYEILSELGRGGMGVVYRARQIAANRIVALKMILAGGHAGAADLARFRTKAQAVARLQHPGIVQVFDVGEHQGLPFFSLELVEGGSLDKKLAGTPLPPRRATRLVERIAEAIHAAHCQHIVHRDLKPANILLTGDGQPKVTDFGLAKTLDVEQGHTATGAVMGTPSYMAPEQADGQSKKIGPATDVYALGAVLYECLTGRPPFKAATPLDTILQALSDEPVPPRRLQPKIPRDVETICLKCLRKEPSKRYASAAELAEDLRRFRDGEPIRARPVGMTERVIKWVKRRPALAALVAVIVLAAVGLSAGGIGFTLRLDKERRRAETFAIAEGKARTEAEDKQREADAAKQEALTQLARAELSLYVNLLDRADRESETHDLLRANVFLDDCRRDYRNWEWRHLRQRSHYTVPLHTFRGNANIVSNVLFSPEGSLLVNISAGLRPPGIVRFDERDNKLDEVKVWDVRTGMELFSLKGHTRSIWSVAISPDGCCLASASDDRTVRLWDARTGAKLIPPLQHSGPVWSVVFSPDSGCLASVSGARRGPAKLGEVKVWDTRTGIELFSLKDHVEPYAQVVFSPDGRLLAINRNDQAVQVCDARTGGTVFPLKKHGGPVHRVGFSPDGSRLVSVSGFQVPGNKGGEVKVWDVRTGVDRLSLKEQISPFANVLFSPDGKRLAIAGYYQTVSVYDARTGNSVLSLREESGAVANVVFSPTAADWPAPARATPERTGSQGR